MLNRIAFPLLLLGLLACRPLSAQITNPPQEQPLDRAQKWQQFLDQLADPQVTMLRAPAGRWELTRLLRIERANLTLDLSDAILQPVHGTYQPLVIGGTAERSENHAFAVVTETTDSLTVDDPSEIQVGDLHYLKIGVNRWDPNEAQYSVIRQVVALEGDRVRYDRPFGIAAARYPSFEELARISGYPDKVGPWQEVPGTYKRGLGTDHGYRKILQVAQNVRIIRPTIDWPADSRLYGSWAVTIGYAREVSVQDLTVLNPCGSCLHVMWSEDCQLDGLTVRGTGRHAPFGPAHIRTGQFTAPLLTGWGASGCSFRRLDAEGRDLSLVDLEAGCRNLLIEGVRFRSSYSPHIKRGCLFGVYGPSQVEFRNVSLDVPPHGSLLFPAGLSDVVFRDLKIETEQLPDWFQWTNGRGRYEGSFRWGAREFLPPDEQTFDVLIERDGQPIPYPAGIVMSATLLLESRDGIRNITLPSEVFLNNPEKLELPAYTGATSGRLGQTYEQYRQVVLGGHKVWIERGQKIPLKVRCQIMALRK